MMGVDASIDYARQFAAMAISRRSHDAEVEEQEVLQLEEVLPGHDGHDKSDDNSISSDTSFNARLDSTALRLFRTPLLRPNQRAAVRRILLDPSSDCKLLLCERTGGGKSLTLYMTAVCVGGLALLIITLLFCVSSNKGLSFSFTPNTQTTWCTTASRPLLASRKGGEQTKQIKNQPFRGRQIRQGGLQSRVAVGEVGRQSDHAGAKTI